MALLIGAHTSIAGGLYNSVEIAASIGATTLQIFTANQRRWFSKPLSDEAIEKFIFAKERFKMQSVGCHASYLINLGSPKKEVREKSREAFREEIKRAKQLGLAFIIFHPGAALSSSREQSLNFIVEGLLSFEDLLKDDYVRLLIENTAGQGSLVGCCFEELGFILKETYLKIPIGICLDTCHLFASGYDIRTPKDWNKTLEEFDEKIGTQHLYAFHLNDSVYELGSRKDRHATIGGGFIGIDSFRYLVTNEKTKSIPKYLETPGGPIQWEKEISMIKKWE